MFCDVSLRVIQVLGATHPQDLTTKAGKLDENLNFVTLEVRP